MGRVILQDNVGGQERIPSAGGPTPPAFPHKLTNLLSSLPLPEP